MTRAARRIRARVEALDDDDAIDRLHERLALAARSIAHRSPRVFRALVRLAESSACELAPAPTTEGK